MSKVRWPIIEVKTPPNFRTCELCAHSSEELPLRTVRACALCLKQFDLASRLAACLEDVYKHVGTAEGRWAIDVMLAEWRSELGNTMETPEKAGGK